MLKRKLFTPPLKNRPGARLSAYCSTWALVAFWLLVILLAATALALGANYGSLHGGAAREAAAAPDQAIAAPSVPAAVQ
jgi:hypothetical protein